MLRVKEIAKEKGISMSEVAKRMNMTAPGLSMALSRNLTLDVMKRIADALEVEIWELFTKKEKTEIAGFVKVKGNIYEITSKEDIDKLLNLLK